LRLWRGHRQTDNRGGTDRRLITGTLSFDRHAAGGLGPASRSTRRLRDHWASRPHRTDHRRRHRQRTPTTAVRRRVTPSLAERCRPRSFLTALPGAGVKCNLALVSSTQPATGARRSRRDDKAASCSFPGLSVAGATPSPRSPRPRSVAGRLGFEAPTASRRTATLAISPDPTKWLEEAWSFYAPVGRTVNDGESETPGHSFRASTRLRSPARAPSRSRVGRARATGGSGVGTCASLLRITPGFSTTRQDRHDGSRSRSRTLPQPTMPASPTFHRWQHHDDRRRPRVSLIRQALPRNRRR